MRCRRIRRLSLSSDQSRSRQMAGSLSHWRGRCFLGGAVFRWQASDGTWLGARPGRYAGSSIYLKGIPSRPDYEIPVKACIDYFVSRPELDPDRIAVIGISMAGYYAPRATVRRLLGGVTDEEAREQLKAFTMEGIAQNIKCPTLITHGGHDIRMSVEGAKRLFNEISANDKTFKIYDDPKAGGTIHCSHDYW